jgi:pimeloyl-ACP methyl ester carboxylesterase
MYQPRRASRSEFVPIRNLRYHVRLWGEPGPGKVPLVMVHGWMDVAASYQFVVDAFAADHYVIAPDWRGYGLTEQPPTDNYWFPDYLADLDFLLDHYVGDTPVHLVGHSMGGNIAMLYSGARPKRIARLVNLEGFGMPATRPSQAPGRYAKWMDELKTYHRGELDLKGYDSIEGVARRLMKTNRRLTQDKADWLAQHWAARAGDGTWRILGHAAHKIVNASLYRVDEILEIYKAIQAPVLAVEASDDSLAQWWQGRFTLAEYHERLKAVSDLRISRIDDAGHMLHHDQPHQLAQVIEEFIGSGSGETPIRGAAAVANP